MSYTVSLAQRIKQLEKVQAQLPQVLAQVAKTATIAAVHAAVDATPPKTGTGRGAYIGTNTVTGELKARWETDSVVQPQAVGTSYHTMLCNGVEYASYVDQGHRMDRHFVPGLYINPDSGLLEYDGVKKVGLVVGTKTKYVKGEFMVDKAKKAYEQTVIGELDKEIGRLFR